MAVRAALGAGRHALLSQLASEALLQAALGALAGVLFAWLSISALPAVLPGGIIPTDAAIGLSPRLILFVLAIAAMAALLVGLAPAWQLVRTSPVEVLNADAGRSTGGRATRRLHQFIVAFEVAAAVAVTGSAALLTVNTWQLLDVDRGFNSSEIVAARFTLPLTKYDGTSSLAFFDSLLERVRAIPAVENATLSNQPPPGVFSRSQFSVAGRTPDTSGRLPTTFYTTVGSHFPDTLGLRLLKGRWLDAEAAVTAPREVVINQTLASRYFGGEDPIGQRVTVIGPANDGTPADVVGVVADVRNAGLASEPQPEMFASVRQIPDRRRTQLYLVVRGRQDALALPRAPGLRSADPRLERAAPRAPRSRPRSPSR
jgi:putative ABC transport system permease protein